MSLAQALLLAALLALAAVLLRAIHGTLRVLEPQAFARPWPLPLLHAPLMLLAHFAGPRLRLPWRAAQRAHLLAAGFAERPTPPEWFALRCLVATLTATALPVAAWLGGLRGLWYAAVPALLAGLCGPPLWLRLRVRRRRRAIDADLLLHLEMLLAGLEVGLDWPASLRCAARSARPGLVQQALAACVAESPAGSEAAEVLARLDRRLQSPAAHRILRSAQRAQAAGVGLRSALYAVIAREEGRQPAGADAAGARGSRWWLARPLLAGALPAIVLLVILARPP